MNRSEHFPCAASSVTAARRFVASAIDFLPSDVTDTAVLLVSELATNAVVHASTAFTVDVEWVRDRLRLEVTDEGLGSPAPRPAGLTDEHGRGLQLVRSLSSAWGVERQGPVGKGVWFELAT